MLGRADEEGDGGNEEPPGESGSSAEGTPTVVYELTSFSQLSSVIIELFWGAVPLLERWCLFCFMIAEERLLVRSDWLVKVCGGCGLGIARGSSM